MSSIERELLEILSRLDDEKKRQILEFARKLQQPQSSQLATEEFAALPMEERHYLIIRAMRLIPDDGYETAVDMLMAMA